MSSKLPNSEWFIELMQELHDKSFYGKIIFEIKKGRVFLVRQEETIKPPDNSQ